MRLNWSLTATLLGLQSLASAGILRDCGSREVDILLIESLTATPEPLSRGNEATITVTGDLLEDVVAGAKMKARVKIGPIKVFDSELDLCEQLKSVGKECPLPAGPTVISHTFTVPPEAPPGRYNAQVELYTSDRRSIGCINADVRL